MINRSHCIQALATATAAAAASPMLSAIQFGELFDRHSRGWGRVIAPLNIQLD